MESVLKSFAKCRAAKALDHRVVQRISVEPPCGPVMSEQRRYPGGNLIDIARIDQFAESAAVERIDRSVAVAGEHRRPARHCLEEYNSETLARARHCENIGQPIVIGKLFVAHESGERNLALDSELARECLHPRAVRSSAHQKEADRTASRIESRERTDNLIVSLVALAGSEASHRQHDFLVLTNVVSGGERF